MARVQLVCDGIPQPQGGYAAAYQVIHFGQRSGDDNLSYSFFGGAPFQLEERMTPFLQSNRTVYHAIYAQDQWTLKRLTLQAGLRYERAIASDRRWRERGPSEPVQPHRSRVPAFDRCHGPERYLSAVRRGV